MADSVAIPTLGTEISLNGTPIGQIQDITGPQLSTDTDEITNHSSPDHTEEFIATIKRTGEITFPLVFYPGDAGHLALLEAKNARSKDAYVMTYPDEDGISGGGESWDFNAYCTGFSLTAPVGGHLAAAVTLRVTGAPAFSALSS
jgi:hypothetical protein